MAAAPSHTLLPEGRDAGTESGSRAQQGPLSTAGLSSKSSLEGWQKEMDTHGGPASLWRSSPQLPCDSGLSLGPGHF